MTNISGTTATIPWFVEPSGLRISATVCLKCGTTFGTHGAPIKALFTLGSSLITTKYVFSASDVTELLARDPTSVPAGIVSLLEQRGFLDLTPKEVRFGDLISEEEGHLLVDSIERALLQLAAFCDTVARGEVSERSLGLFLELSDTFEQTGVRNIHTEAAVIIRDLLGAVTPNELLARTKELRSRASGT